MKLKEFIDNWKKGMAMITPRQQLEAQQKGNWVMALGLLCGVIAMAFNLRTWWWSEFILVAALFNQSVTILGVWQKLAIFKDLEKFDVELPEEVIEPPKTEIPLETLKGGKNV